MGRGSECARRYRHRLDVLKGVRLRLLFGAVFLSCGWSMDLQAKTVFPWAAMVSDSPAIPGHGSSEFRPSTDFHGVSSRFQQIENQL